MVDRILNHLCDYALNLSYRDLPEEVIRQAKHIVLDTVGCALGGAESPPAKIARAAAEITSAVPSTVLIGGQKTSPDLAAFANGVMIRYLDFNDTYAGSPTCHPSDLLAPVLAVVDARHGDGEDVILGTVLGYEVFCGLVDAGANERGHIWVQSTYGVIAAAVVAAKLFGLMKEQMCNAISLAVASHISLEQIRRGQISHWKGCALATASRNAVFCAMLAAKGMTGPEEAFEGKAGFLASTGIRFEIMPFAESADDYRIMKARVKAFPAGYFSQSAIEAILNLRSQISNFDDIKDSLANFSCRLRGHGFRTSELAAGNQGERRSQSALRDGRCADGRRRRSPPLRPAVLQALRCADAHAKNQRADRRRTRCRLAGSSLEHRRHRDEVRKGFLNESGLSPRPFQTVDDRRGTGA